MFCEKCGNQLQDGAKFCTGCGAQVEAASGRSIPKTPRIPCVPPSEGYPAQGKPQRTVQYEESAPNIVHDAVLSVGQYIGMFLLLCIPILNVILLFVWSFGHSANRSKRNFARAALILGAISLILWLIAGGAIMSALGDMIGGGYY